MINNKMGKIIIALALSIFLISLVSAFPNNLSVNVQTTDASGNILTGTYTFNFTISPNNDCSAPVYSNQQTLATDSRGIINITLPDVDVEFSSANYRLCYRRGGVLKSNSLIASSPYSYFARNTTTGGLISDSNVDVTPFNISADWFFGNITGQEFWYNMSIAGVSNIFDQWLNTTSNVTFSNITATFIDIIANLSADWIFGKLNHSYIQNDPFNYNQSGFDSYNYSLASYTMWSSSWNSTYNESYAGLINNETYYSTYNETYHGLINNASYLSTYNATYHLWAYNSSLWLFDLLNGTYAPFWYNYTGTGLYYYNQSGFDSYNYSLASYTMWSSSWNSTYNETYHGLINNASYLSTYNKTYAGWIYNQTESVISYLSNSNVTVENLTVSKSIFIGDNLSISEHLFLGSSDSEHVIYFYESAGFNENISWSDSLDAFIFSDELRVADDIVCGGYVSTAGVVSSGSDIYTTGAGDDFWLGDSSKANANIHINESGSAYFLENVSSDSFYVGNKICLSSDCTKYMEYNGATILIQG
jgi:hypothetical protein